MTRLPGLDPEVLADLRRREQSSGDRARSRQTRNPFADAATVEHVEHWPCRGGCGRMVGVTAEACEAFATLNGELARRRDRPIAKASAVWCPACKQRDEDLAATQRELERDRRRPHEQQQIAGVDTERPSGMRAAGKGRR